MKAVNCLSLSGGGSRGLIQLHQVEAFADISKKKVFHENFDFIAGTSTGALACALFAAGYSPSDAIHIYRTELPSIFKKKCFRFGLRKPKYDNTYISGLAKELLGDLTLGQCTVNLMIPTYNSDKDEVKIFKTHNQEDKDYLLREVVLASAAAPTYFFPVQINEEWYKDGGLGYNNPADILLKECRSYKHEEINILSITTGSTTSKTSRAEIRGHLMKTASVAFDEVLREQDVKTHDGVIFDYKYSVKGLYARCQSLIKHSSGKIDDVSKRNIQAMIKDGQLSAEVNHKLLSAFNLKIKTA